MGITAHSWASKLNPHPHSLSLLVESLGCCNVLRKGKGGNTGVLFAEQFLLGVLKWRLLAFHIQKRQSASDVLAIFNPLWQSEIRLFQVGIDSNRGRVVNNRRIDSIAG